LPSVAHFPARSGNGDGGGSQQGLKWGPFRFRPPLQWPDCLTSARAEPAAVGERGGRGGTESVSILTFVDLGKKLADTHVYTALIRGEPPRF